MIYFANKSHITFITLVVKNLNIDYNYVYLKFILKQNKLL